MWETRREQRSYGGVGVFATRDVPRGSTLALARRPGSRSFHTQKGLFTYAFIYMQIGAARATHLGALGGRAPRSGRDRLPRTRGRAHTAGAGARGLLPCVPWENSNHWTCHCVNTCVVNLAIVKLGVELAQVFCQLVLFRASRAGGRRARDFGL